VEGLGLERLGPALLEAVVVSRWIRTRSQSGYRRQGWLRGQCGCAPVQAIRDQRENLGGHGRGGGQAREATGWRHLRGPPHRQAFR